MASVGQVTQEMAQAAYLGMDGKRSLRNLQILLVEKYGADEKVPAFRTLGKWSKKYQWVAAAEKFDAEVAKAIAEKVQVQQIEDGFDAVSQLTDAAEKCLVAATTALDSDERLIKSADDLSKVLTSALELLREALVRTTGPAPVPSGTEVNVNLVHGEDFADIGERFRIPSRKFKDPVH